MVQLQTDPFLNELNKMYERNKGKGTVWVTMKRSTMKSRNARIPDPNAVQTCLIRATDGKRKVATTVNVKEMVRFSDAYSTIMKAHTGALKRKEKERKPRAKKPPA